MKIKFETVSLPAHEKELLKEISEQEHRSMAGQIRYWIDQYRSNKSQTA